MTKWLGTRYRFHPLFILMMLGSAVTGLFLEAATLFGVVLIHELGHVAAAKGFGWRVKEVQLLPFGGVAVVEELGSVSAREELLVALAGPLQHVWMMALAWAMQAVGAPGGDWWGYFWQVNAMIAMFNLLPILPLDGGKVMMCLLSYAMSYHRAMVYSVWASLVLSSGVVLAAIGQGVFGGAGSRLQLNLAVIGLFLLVSNWYALKQRQFHFMRFLMNRSLRAESLIGQGALAQPIVVPKGRRIADVVKLLMRDKYHLIYVLGERGRIQAVVPEQQLVRGFLEGKKAGSAVSELFM
ncbi:M50 family metallopeptidase [Paenibacillus athensensis]|uniref:Zn-dependent protease n=1 Tax=Paenibacillus athensensis TaxID=1967502 RepID=A0A4Y8PVM6_9BACL|nr:M50 family metallopeptidase [Paenibacillus athensensis]MCD1258214.1 M50 family metallopeptidase [Paenibacillus athensensis]